MAKRTTEGALDRATILALRVFVTVAEANSFSAAARQLRLAPSAVTNHVLALERSIGFALFHRTTRRVAITEAGEHFYRKCARIIPELDSTLNSLVPSEAKRGQLRVTAPPSFAVTVLAPNLVAFLERHPLITVDLRATSTLQNMISERIDLTFALRESLNSKVHHIRIARNDRAFCASPNYLSRCGYPKLPADLLRHRCLANMIEGVSERWSVKIGGRLTRLKLNNQFMADNGEVLRRACLKGAGVGCFYRFHVRDDLERGDLTEVLRPYQPNTNFIYAITLHREMMLPHVQLFLDFVRSIITESDRDGLERSVRRSRS